MPPVYLENVPRIYYAPAFVSKPGYTIQISGQVGTTSNPQAPAPASYESQIDLALLNLKKSLFAAGAKITDIIKLTLYIVTYVAKKRLHTRHVQRFLGSHCPAITLLPVTQLAVPELLFKVEAVAVCSDYLSRKPLEAPLNSALDSQVDVIIVRAGISGSTAARQLIRAGSTCVVLEARDRVGGKTWSQSMEDGKGFIDVGAAWSVIPIKPG